jgi:hypothetical protein
MHPTPLALAPIAQNSISPLMELLGTVAIPHSTPSKQLKQMEKKMIGVERKKNFKVSSTIDEN